MLFESIFLFFDPTLQKTQKRTSERLETTGNATKFDMCIDAGGQDIFLFRFANLRFELCPIKYTCAARNANETKQ
jgi:hypothetical protein